jgi:hypothetical protein
MAGKYVGRFCWQYVWIKMRKPTWIDNLIAKLFWKKWTPIFKENKYWREFLVKFVAELTEEEKKE